MHKFTHTIVIFFIFVGCAQAGDWAPRDEAIKNFASGYAFVMLCSINSYAKTTPAAQLGNAYKNRMTETSYKKFRDQYQRSIHEKTIYSIALKKWVPFNVTSTDCKTVDRTVEIYLKRLSNGS